MVSYEKLRINKPGLRSACRSCSSRFGQLKRRGHYPHWVPIFEPANPPIMKSENTVVISTEKPEQKKQAKRTIGCYDCAHGVADKNSESGWVCAIYAAMRCGPWAKKLAYVKK